MSELEPNIPLQKAAGAKKKPVLPTDKYTRILVEENDGIPPTGLFIGLNGKSYMLRPGEPVNVPSGILDILNNAVTSTPVIDPATKQVIGHRDRMRFPYRVLPPEPTDDE